MPRTTKLKRTRDRVHLAACGAYCDFFGGNPEMVKGTMPQFNENNTVADLIGCCVKAVMEGTAEQARQ